MQQEEVLAPLDEDERQALRRRLVGNRGGSGAFATSRPGGKASLAGYGSARDGGELPPTGFMSPVKQRIQAQTARREQEVRTARDNEKKARERARRAAFNAAKQREQQQREYDAQQEEARQTLATRRQFQQERARVAADLASKVNVPAFGTKLARAMPPPPTEKALLRKKRQV